MPAPAEVLLPQVFIRPDETAGFDIEGDTDSLSALASALEQEAPIRVSGDQ